MPEPRTISGRKFLAIVALLSAATLAAAWFIMLRPTPDANLQVIIHPLPATQSIAALYFWPHPFPPENLRNQDVPQGATRANRVGDDFLCSYPIHHQKSWSLIGKTDCEPIPHELTLWLKTTDGTWTFQTIPFPKTPNEQGNWSISLIHQ